MRKISIFTLLLASLAFMFACGGTNHQEANHQHEAMPNPAEDKQEKSSKIALDVPNFDSTKISKTEVEAMIEPYLSLKDAFVASNLAESQKRASALVEAIKNEALQSVKTDAQNIQQATDLDTQRLHFYQLSAKVFFLVKNIGGNKQMLYQQYCPMAFNDQGAYWLSKEDKIRNPYFGDEMLTCGMVNEKLAVK